MSVDKYLESIETVILSRQLSPVERLVLHQSWVGRTYTAMSQDSGYGNSYLKEIGSQLWEALSKAVGKKVTKKNLNLVLSEYLEKQTQTNVVVAIPKLAHPSPGAALAAKSPLYVNRPPVEELACAEISQPGCLLQIKAPRKMGKTSLLNQIVGCARDWNYHVVYLDFQETEEAVFLTLDKFLRWFCLNISRQLNLEPRLEDYWDEEMGSKVSCKIYINNYILKKIDRPIILAFNELNRIFDRREIVQEFLPMLRFWHEQAQRFKSWQKLRLVLVQSTEIYFQIKLNQSPFNVGLSLRLPQFNLEQVRELALRYGLTWLDNNQLKEIMAMVGGHPYLVNLAFYYLRREKILLEELLQVAPTPAGIYSNHLRGYLTMLRDEPQLKLALQQVVNAGENVKLEAITAYKLESMGLIELEGFSAKPSCELYRLYFRQQLGREREEKDRQILQRFSRKANKVDELTQLANRNYFQEYLETQWQQCQENSSFLSMLFCNIDYFDFYSKAFGEEAAATCIQQIGITIDDCVMRYPSALVGRYESTKFGVLLPGVDQISAVAIAENIRQSVKALAIAHDRSVYDGFPEDVLTVSIGGESQIPQQHFSSDLLIMAVNEVLVLAKKEGGNRVVFNS
ncbi:AAA-like domain-containing protein [Oscillatoria salina]|uniref:AAA-like domain-containing protein n=1 Tax=Oscillatoria salina TaxID=331517 RepID=UPI0013BB4E75|nr:AAA-like domain-containing protein [Oscillatoria salina]MBZ8181295.1 diguanylate cyclase [Oscillatoria salina IIICB1]NET86860.1 diguanylate cyclase [Kamptonema sp. SIO1D9]